MPATSVPNSHLLSPVDQILPPFYTNLCLHFSSTRKNKNELPAILQRAVDELVKRLPWIAGEVVQGGDKGLLRIQQPTSPSPVPMIQFATNSSLTIEQITGACTRTGAEELHLLQRLPALPLFADPSGPTYVARFKATSVSDGVILGMSCSHCVFDVTGAAHLLEHLAEACRKAVPPPCDCLDDQSLRQGIWTLGSATQTGHARTDKLADAFSQGPETYEEDMHSLAERIIVCRWKIPGQKVATLKSACNALLASQLAKDNDPSIHFLSSLDVLTGFVTRAIHPKPDTPEGVSDVAVVVNLRDRLTPPLASSYTGNFVRMVPVPHPSGSSADPLLTAAHTIAADNRMEIAASDLASVYRNACAVRQMVSGVDDVYVRSYISWLASHPDLRQVHSPVPPTCFSSWRHISLYDTDFGPLGRPDDVLTHGLSPVTACIILPRRSLEEDVASGFDLLLCLKRTDYSRIMENGFLRSLIE